MAENKIGSGCLRDDEVTQKAPIGISRVSSFETCVLGKNAYVGSACFIAGNKLLFSHCDGHCLYKCNKDGTEPERLPLDGAPYDTTVYSPEEILIAMGDKGVQLFNLSERASKGYLTKDPCMRITSVDQRIWVLVDKFTIHEIDINGKTLKRTATDFCIRGICGSKTGDLFCSEYVASKVHCIKADGVKKMLYTSPKLRGAGCLDADSQGNVYVPGDNIHKISHDGSGGQVILTSGDGVDVPIGVIYNWMTNELLMINACCGEVIIYKLS